MSMNPLIKIIQEREWEFEKKFPNDSEFCCCGREYCYPKNAVDYEPLRKFKSHLTSTLISFVKEEIKMLEGRKQATSDDKADPFFSEPRAHNQAIDDHISTLREVLDELKKN